MKTYYNIIEVLVSICATDEGKLKILLKRKKTEPYKGYWILPGNILSNDATLEDCVSKIVLENTGIPYIMSYQNGSMSNLERDPEDRVIAETFTALTIKKFVKSSDMEWFDIKSLPKMAYDHETIINESFNTIKTKIIHNEEDILLNLFPTDFTLSDLQKFFENILGRKLDRRNFRKKLLKSKIVCETGERVNTAGRPSMLYTFNKEERVYE